MRIGKPTFQLAFAQRQNLIHNGHCSPASERYLPKKKKKKTNNTEKETTNFEEKWFSTHPCAIFLALGFGEWEWAESRRILWPAEGAREAAPSAHRSHELVSSAEIHLAGTNTNPNNPSQGFPLKQRRCRFAAGVALSHKSRLFRWFSRFEPLKASATGTVDPPEVADKKPTRYISFVLKLYN